MPADQAPGLLQPGNIDLANRPVVRNADGSISTVRSMSFNQDGREVLIPTVVGGKVVSQDEAIANYRKTGENLGMFSTPEQATAFAQTLHEQQAQMYAPPSGQPQLPRTAPMPPYKQEEVTVAPAAPAAPAPVTHTAGRGGIPMPVLQAGHGRGAAAPPSPRIAGAAPAPLALQAAQAAGVPPQAGGTAPIQNAAATLLPAGVMPWGPGAAFNDPNSGRERLFATPEQAASAYTRLASPAGQEQSRAELIQHLSNLAAEGTPAVSPNYPIQPGQEGAHRLTSQEFGMLPQSSVAPPLAPPVQERQQPDAPSFARDGGPSGSEPNRKLEIIRGMNSQVYNINPQGKSPEEIYREQVTDSMLANLSAGVGTAGPQFSVDEKGNPTRVPNPMEHLQELEDAKRKGLLSLDDVKAGRASELLRDPSGISEADQLLFAPKQSQAGQKREVYKQPVYDEYGAKIGETPYTYNPYDAASNATPLNLGESQQPEGRPVGYPDAYQAVKPDGKLGWFVKRKGKTFLVSK